MEEQGYALGKGVLPTSIVTRLSGVSAARLLRWRRLGLIRASVVNGRRGVPIVYSWADYQRIRAVAALVRAGVSPSALLDAVEQLDHDAPKWCLRVLTDRERDTAERVVGIRALAALDRVWGSSPLGEFSSFADAVNMDPRIRSGWPVVRGTRIPTPVLSGMYDAGDPIDELAVDFELSPSQIKRVIDFEHRLWGHPHEAHAPAAG